MRTTLWISLLSTAVLAGGACKRKTETEKDMDRAATSAQKAQEDVNKNAKDVRDEQKDVTKAENNLNKQESDVAKQQGELNAAETNLAQARDRFVTAAKDRLAQLDQKIQDLSARTDAKAKEVAATAKIKRDEIAQKIENAKMLGTTDPAVRHDTGTKYDPATGHTTVNDDKSFKDFKKDLDDSFDKVEKDVNDALK